MNDVDFCIILKYFKIRISVGEINKMLNICIQKNKDYLFLNLGAKRAQDTKLGQEQRNVC